MTISSRRTTWKSTWERVCRTRVPLELASQDQVVAAIDFQSQHLVEPVDRKGGTQISGHY